MSILKTNQITDLGGNELLTSNGSGVISSGGAITNTPAFEAKLTSDQAVSDNTLTKINFNSGGSSTLDVFCTLPSSKAVYLDENGDAVGAAGPGFAVAMAIAL